MTGGLNISLNRSGFSCVVSHILEEKSSFCVKFVIGLADRQCHLHFKMDISLHNPPN